MAINNKKQKVVFGLLGSGAYADVHAKAYINHPDCILKSVWSPTRKNREKFAKKFNITPAESWQAVIDDPEIDCIAVATPDYAHTEYTIYALEAGKDVLVEKPMAMSVKECEQIIKARDKSGQKLMVNYHNRWYPALAEAKKIIDAGTIGKPISGNFILSDSINWTRNNMTWADKSGPEWFLMSHLTDLALWLLDDLPDSIQAFAHEGILSAEGINCKDLVKANVLMRRGTVIHLETSWVLASGWRNPINEFSISIQGEKGRVDVNGDYENLTVVTDGYSTPFTNLIVTEETPINAFIQCVLDDKPVPVTAEEGLNATAFVEGVVSAYSNNSICKFNANT